MGKELPTQLPNVRIGPLIGSNCPKALQPIDVLASEHGGPFAIRTFAGCPLYTCGTEYSNINCNRIAATEVGSGRHLDHHFMVESRVREIVNQQALNKMLELDFSERTENKEQEYSPEDTKCVKIVSQGICHTEDHHYEIPLPFRVDSQWFPENR